MAQQSDGLSLSSEPLDEFAVAGPLRRNDFDGDATACACVSRAIDRPHSAATAKLLDLVLPVEQLANHSVRPDRDLTCGSQERINNLSLQSFDLLEQALAKRRVFQKAFVLLVRGDERLNFMPKRGIVLNGAINEICALFVRAFLQFMK
jgi:hypothetical protein